MNLCQFLGHEDGPYSYPMACVHCDLPAPDSMQPWPTILVRVDSEEFLAALDRVRESILREVAPAIAAWEDAVATVVPVLRAFFDQLRDFEPPPTRWQRLRHFLLYPIGDCWDA